MIEAALQWASEGVPVFPVAGKVPTTEHGLHDASVDPVQIGRWFDGHPELGLGGAMGAPCGCWVFDVDGDIGFANLRLLEERHGALPATRQVRTGGGGLHLWFRMPPDRSIGNRTNVPIPGVEGQSKLDVRGTGGYVVLPPSRHPNGTLYVLIDDTPPADAPEWLLDLVTKKKNSVQAPSKTIPTSDRRRLLGMAAASADRIRAAVEGERNDTVNRECYALGGFLDAAGVSVDEVAPLLEAATIDAQQPPSTVRRALEDGRGDPREMPPDSRPQLRVAARHGREVTIPPREGVELADTQPDPLVEPLLVVRVNAKTEVVTVLPTLPNAMIVLDNDRRWLGRIRWNTFADRIEIDGEPVDDAREAEIVLWMTRSYGTTPSTAHVHEAINAVAHRHPYHPVREYLDGLVWDGVARLDTWLEQYGGIDASEDLPLIRAYSAKWVLSIVARVYQGPDGVKVDTALISAGPKGLRKSSMYKVWGGAWFGDSALPIGDKDAYQSIGGKLVWELAELESVTRRELGTVKAFMTSQIDTYRPSYGRNAVSRPRQCVFCGTVNSDCEPTFLRENDRRWWIVRSIRMADVAGLAAVRDQLFAEAVERYRAGESWWLSSDLERSQRDSVGVYVAQDPWVALIAPWLAKRATEFTVGDVLEHALNRKPEDCDKRDEMRIGGILGQLGYFRRRRRISGVKAYYWTKLDDDKDEGR